MQRLADGLRVLIAVTCQDLVNGHQFRILLADGLNMPLDLDLEEMTRGECTTTIPSGRSTPTYSSPGGQPGARRLPSSTPARATREEPMDESELIRVKQEPVDELHAWVVIKCKPRIFTAVSDVVVLSSDDEEQNTTRGAVTKC